LWGIDKGWFRRGPGFDLGSKMVHACTMYHDEGKRRYAADRLSRQQQQYYKPSWVGNISIGRELLLFLYLGLVEWSFLTACCSFILSKNGNKFAVLVNKLFSSTESYLTSVGIVSVSQPTKVTQEMVTFIGLEVDKS
jgi:hypothetical protein